MNRLVKCLFSPNLYRIYSLNNRDQEENHGFPYTPNSIEHIGSLILKGINICWKIGYFTLPFTLIYLFRNRREYFCIAGCHTLSKVTMGVTMLYILGIVIRGFGRSMNPLYQQFLTIFLEAQESESISSKRLLSNYDFDFWGWPVDFCIPDATQDKSKRHTTFFSSLPFSSSKSIFSLVGSILEFPPWLVTFCFIRMFGRHLIYPGSIEFIQYILEPHLVSGREKLVKVNQGCRNKLISRDGNSIDTMFIDRRHKEKYAHGDTLVICCEGNAGFYELGLLQTPLDGGYSVLGWNHPGFAGSTGSPFPSQEKNAVEAVVEFAILKLGFKVSDIIIYAWSIGGFTGSWAAMNFPEIKGLILDATFDDVLPLAIPRMPGWMSGLVEKTIRLHMNLHVSSQLNQYSGPVTIIRRTRDEIITTVEGNISTNRGNDLLMKLLQVRYPELCLSSSAMHELQKWLSSDSIEQSNDWNLDEELLQGLIASHKTEFGLVYPSSLGEDSTEDDKIKLLLFIAKKIFLNYNNTHNTPLPVEYFRIPWTP